jgi:hypothetical protein
MLVEMLTSKSGPVSSVMRFYWQSTTIHPL